MRVRSYSSPIAMPSLLGVRGLSLVSTCIRGWVPIFVARITTRLVSRLTDWALEGGGTLERTWLPSGVIALVAWSATIIVNIGWFRPCRGAIGAFTVRLLPSILKVVLSLRKHARVTGLLSDWGAVLHVWVSEVPLIIASHVGRLVHLCFPGEVTMDRCWHTVLFMHTLSMLLWWRLLSSAVAVWWILSTLLWFEQVWLFLSFLITLTEIGLDLRQQVFMLTKLLLIWIAVSRFNCVIRWRVLVHFSGCLVKIVVGRAMRIVGWVVDASTDRYWIASRLVNSMIVLHFPFHWWWIIPSLWCWNTILEIKRSTWRESVAVVTTVQIISLSFGNFTSR